MQIAEVSRAESADVAATICCGEVAARCGDAAARCGVAAARCGAAATRCGEAAAWYAWPREMCAEREESLAAVVEGP